MSFVTSLKNLAKKSTWLRILMRETRNFMRGLSYRARGLLVQTNDKMVVFSAYNGRGYVCSPKAVYEYMVKDDRFSDYQFVWLFDNPEKYLHLEKHANTTVVKNRSAECERYLHRAKYWIFNFRALDHWVPRREQVYVQCWHGTPLKKLGYDITNSDNAMNSVKEIRSKYRIDTKRFNYLVSPCKFVTEKFTSAWNLKEFEKESVILETGYPRNDFLSTYHEGDVQHIKEKLGLANCQKKIILYAPTWRDNQHDAKLGYVYHNPIDFSILERDLGEEYIILFRAHYLVADHFDFEAYQGFIYDVSSYDDINELYVIADLLVTDYSSVFFDYAILKRPILFYMYDMEAYRDEIRGFYLDTTKLPGPIIRTELELAESVQSIMKSSAEQWDISAFNQEYNTLNDGKAAERLVNRVFLHTC